MLLTKTTKLPQPTEEQFILIRTFNAEKQSVVDVVGKTSLVIPTISKIQSFRIARIIINFNLCC